MVTRDYHKRACAVVLLKKVKNPIKLAREMLVRGEKDGSNGGDLKGGAGGAQGHCCLGGKTVEKLAEDWGLEMVDESYFWTRTRWDEHERGLQDERTLRQDKVWDSQAYLPQGTVGCVALDQYGTMCVATSTGGLTNKLSGRIGDTPTIGAGFWAEEWNQLSLEKSMRQSQDLSSQIPEALNGLADGLRNAVGDCIPRFSGYQKVSSSQGLRLEKVENMNRAVAMSGKTIPMIRDSKKVVTNLKADQYEQQELVTATHSFVLQRLVLQVPSSVSRPIVLLHPRLLR